MRLCNEKSYFKMYICFLTIYFLENTEQGKPSSQQEPPYKRNENGPPPRRRQGGYKKRKSENESKNINTSFSKLLFSPGSRRRRNRKRGQPMVANVLTATLKFDTDFDFDLSNAQFIKEELERELQNKVHVRGQYWVYF